MKSFTFSLLVAALTFGSCSKTKDEFTLLVYADLPNETNPVELKINSSTLGSIQNQNIELTLNDSTLEQYCFVTQIEEGKHKIYALREDGSEITGSTLKCSANSISSSSINGLGGGVFVQSSNDSILIRLTQ